MASNAPQVQLRYLVDPLADERSLLGRRHRPDRLAGFDLDNMAVTVSTYGPADGASMARLTSMWNLINAPAADQCGSAVPVSRSTSRRPPRRAATLAHEWGRQPFGRDEPRSASTTEPSSHPSTRLCADRRARRRLVGLARRTIDPFVYEVLRRPSGGRVPGRTPRGIEPRHQCPHRRPPSAAATTPPTRDTAFRPSSDSLMNSEIPVWGGGQPSAGGAGARPVSGRGPLDDLDAIELACDDSRAPWTAPARSTATRSADWTVAWRSTVVRARRRRRSRRRAPARKDADDPVLTVDGRTSVTLVLGDGSVRSLWSTCPTRSR
ncbi:MAG: hypothetical protein R2710_12695 [Acidimicrobiales bacterium]